MMLLVLITILLATSVVLLALLPQRLQRLLYMVAREPLVSSSHPQHVEVNTAQTTSLLRAAGSAQDVELVSPLAAGA